MVPPPCSFDRYWVRLNQTHPDSFWCGCILRVCLRRQREFFGQSTLDHVQQPCINRDMVLYNCKHHSHWSNSGMNFAKKNYLRFRCLVFFRFLIREILDFERALKNSALQMFYIYSICPVWENDQIEASKKVFPVSSAHSLTQIIRPDFEF